MSTKWSEIVEQRKKRDEQLVVDYLAKNPDGTYKYDVAGLMIKYDLSQQRIYKILEKMGVKSERGGIQYYNKNIRKPKKGLKNG